MITAIEQPVIQKPEVEMKRPIATPLKLRDRPQDYKRGTPQLLSRVKVFSRHGDCAPPRVASEGELDPWARHAAASNGFGDLI